MDQPLARKRIFGQALPHIVKFPQTTVVVARKNLTGAAVAPVRMKRRCAWGRALPKGDRGPVPGAEWASKCRTEISENGLDHPF